MRILACFSRSRVILDESDPLARVNDREHRNDPKYDRATKPVPDPKVFVPTSIPELHPEYAHSEPYCFAARTDSARVVVEKMRGSKGQPTPDRAEILKEQGLVVVRGPSYAASKTPQSPATHTLENNNIPLTIETPTTADDKYAESDDSVPDENVNNENIPTSRKSTASRSRKSLDSNTALSQTSGRVKSRSKKSPGKPFRLMSRKSKNSLKRVSPSENVLQPRNSNLTESETVSVLERPSSFPTPPASDHSSETTENELLKHMDNTPKELLAPIMVPRMSGAFKDTKNIISEKKRQVRPMVESPAISNDSWGPTDSSQRYEDVEGDHSSGFISMSVVGKEKVVHKASYSPKASHTPAPLLSREKLPALEDTSSHSTVSHSTRSRRKSKPFLPTPESVDTFATLDTQPNLSHRAHDDFLSTEPGSIPEPAALSRNISIGVMSDDIEVVDMPRMTAGGNGYTSIPTPSPQEAARQRIHDTNIDLPEISEKPQGIIRRASSTKRKTVSFHSASPTIIEPNLRAPSSVPRSALLSKEINTASKAVKSSAPSLQNARDSVALASSPIPRTIETATSGVDRRQDSFTSDDTFQERSSRRMSTRVMVKDKRELREASKRQSKAVAAAMAEQIKGVPKSAMLAFSENEIELADSFPDSEQDSSLSSLRRKSRASKSIRMPQFVPGVVPAPPPPPPFVPDMPRARSIRAPPPPPASPLRY